MVLLITLLLLLILLAGLLLARIEVYIDTYQQLYRLRWGIAFSVRIDTSQEWPAFIAYFGPIRKQWNVLDLVKRHPKPQGEDKPQPDSKRRKTTKAFPFRLIGALLNTFRLRKFQMELDTDDYVWNAWLFTPIYLTPALWQHIDLNFMGHNGLVLQIDNRLWNVEMAALRYYLNRSRFLTKLQIS
jgi:hypothetical protein